MSHKERRRPHEPLWARVLLWLSVSLDLLLASVQTFNPALAQEWLYPGLSGAGGLALLELSGWSALGRALLTLALTRAPVMEALSARFSALLSPQEAHTGDRTRAQTDTQAPTNEVNLSALLISLLWLKELPAQLWALLSLHHLGVGGSVLHALSLLIGLLWLTRSQRSSR